MQLPKSIEHYASYAFRESYAMEMERVEESSNQLLLVHDENTYDH